MHQQLLKARIYKKHPFIIIRVWLPEERSAKESWDQGFGRRGEGQANDGALSGAVQRRRVYSSYSFFPGQVFLITLLLKIERRQIESKAMV